MEQEQVSSMEQELVNSTGLGLVSSMEQELVNSTGLGLVSSTIHLSEKQHGRSHVLALEE